MQTRLSYVIGRLDHVLRRRVAEAIAPHGLTVAQYTALSVLRTQPGLSNAQLARQALITPQSMNEVLAQLEAQKLIRRTPDPRHPRAIATELLPRGEHVLAACDNEVDVLEQDLLAGLHVSEVEQFQEMLAGCVRRLGVGV
jgi:DNA-binding MarR family transcriptional regulator